MEEYPDYTTIRITKKTRAKLVSLRITKREDYDEIINRMIKEFNGEAIKVKKLKGGVK